jgi:hypothetical protein
MFPMVNTIGQLIVIMEGLFASGPRHLLPAKDAQFVTMFVQGEQGKSYCDDSNRLGTSRLWFCLVAVLCLP